MSEDPQKSTGHKGLYIVIQVIGGTGPCQVISEEDPYAAIYRQVYGPASYAECKSWAEENCSAR